MTVRHNAAAHRYEIDTDSGLGVAVYREQGDRMIFTHTEVPRADEGKGFASRLVGAALADAHKRGFKSCRPVASAWPLFAATRITTIGHD